MLDFFTYVRKYMNKHITSESTMSAQLKHSFTIGDIAASALALGVITSDQEHQINEALWLGRFDVSELNVLDRLIDALFEGSVQRLDICFSA